MASTLETLVVKLVADASKLEQELNNQVRQAERAGVKIGNVFAGAAKTVGVFGVAAIGATTALTAFANRAAQYADTIDKAAIRTRLGRDTLQELAFAADQAGVRFEAIEQNIRAFTGRLAEAERGSVVVAGTFERLGVALRDQSGALRDTEALFLDTLTALSSVRNETERAALAVQAFGETGSELLPFLSQGADGIDTLRQRARDLGLVLDNDGIAALVSYKDQLSEVQQQFGALQRELATKFLPLLTDDLIPFLRNDLLPAFETLANFVADKVVPAVQGAVQGFNDLTGAWEAFVTSFEQNGNRLEATVNLLLTIQRALGLDPNQGLDDVRDRLISPQGSGGRAGGVLDAYLGPDFNNLPTAFGPQPGVASPAAAAAAAGRPGAPTGTPADPVTVVLRGDAFPSGNQRGRVAPFGRNSANPDAVGAFLRDQLFAEFGPFGPGATAFAPQRVPGAAPGVAPGRGGATFNNLVGLQDAFVARVLAEIESEDAVLRFGQSLERLFAAAREATPAVDAVAESTGAAERGLASFRLTLEALAERGRAQAQENAAAAEAAAAEAAAIARSGQDLEELFRGARVLQTLETRARLEALAAEAAADANAELQGFQVRLELLAQAGRAAAVAVPAPFAPLTNPFNDQRTGVGVRGGGRFGTIDVAAAQANSVAQFAANAQAEAARDFRQQIALAAVDFTTDLVSAIRSGDIGAAFQSALGLGGSVLSGLGQFGGAAFGLANAGLFGFIGSLLPAIGGLFGALFGGREESEATRALGASTRGAPAIELNLTVNQSLNVQSLTGAGRTAVDGLLDETVRRIEDVIVRNLVPRVNALEAKVA